jgi:hypothetical protein
MVAGLFKVLLDSSIWAAIDFRSAINVVIAAPAAE